MTEPAKLVILSELAATMSHLENNMADFLRKTQEAGISEDRDWERLSHEVSLLVKTSPQKS